MKNIGLSLRWEIQVFEKIMISQLYFKLMVFLLDKKAMDRKCCSSFLNSNVDGCAEVHSHSLISSHGSEGLKTESKDAPLVKVSFKKTV